MIPPSRDRYDAERPKGQPHAKRTADISGFARV
jgi:hypothetical protein